MRNSHTYTEAMDDVNGGTMIELAQEFPEAVPEGAAEGWSSMLDSLQVVLESP